MKIFEDDALAVSLSSASRQKALELFDAERNGQTMERIYREIAGRV